MDYSHLSLPEAGQRSHVDEGRRRSMQEISVTRTLGTSEINSRTQPTPKKALPKVRLFFSIPFTNCDLLLRQPIWIHQNFSRQAALQFRKRVFKLLQFHPLPE